MTFPPPSNPMAVARVLLPAWTDEERPTLLHWRGQWMQWEGMHWRELDASEVRSVAYKELEHATFEFETPKGGTEVKDWAPTKKKIADLLEAMSAIRILSPVMDAPTWTDGTPQHAPIVACTNGLLNVTTQELRPLTPEYFNLVSVPFDYVPEATCPNWLTFLSKVWGDDLESIRAVQEWFGYVLSGRTDQQKILLIVGPTRSGKGTIARVLGMLVGKGNVAGPTLAGLATNFGLSPLLGKPLAVISDARLGGRDGHQVVERLLTISGEDTIDVDRKYREPWTGKIPARLMILSNQLPNFGDASGVIARRFIVLNMAVSWLGKEDTALTDKLAAELPGILNWALLGLARLERNGRIAQPSSAADSITTMQDTASPMSAFVRDQCETGPACSTPVDVLWEMWKDWAEGQGVRAGTKAVFGRDLLSVEPRIRRTKPRIGGRQVPVYEGIGVRSYADNGDSPGSPGSPGNAAGQDDANEPGTPAHPGSLFDGEPDVSRDSETVRLSETTGQEAVSRGEPGEPGDSPLLAQLRLKTPCANCRREQWNADGSPLCGPCRDAA
ncbi:phage/plasmid primase, P4 family [Streptomyces kunmingensis]|uniref:Phage/plasmid primase, P4 family n=1 Tax=Streptomyces kunmingensis TaxID=68225 RepID=A0ABU6CNG2_9ACTN|nr:phage/plasmid primase, P4 family [Streptomyces kunmingensis]MEB3966251.1 phage/plasmid primase, P4 family [Streptomyces kunmingensis]